MLHALPTMLLAGALAGSAPDVLPPTAASPTIGVSVLVERGVPATLVQHILDEADAIWRPAGVRFAWHRGVGDGATLHVVIDQEAGVAGDAETPLGWVAFDGRGVPAPDIHLSYRNAHALLEASYGTSAVDRMPILERDTLLGYAIGRALAHEVGHYLLATKVHTPAGLMQTRRSAFDLFSPDRSHFQIDAAERTRVAARLMAPLNADAAAVRSRRGAGARE